MAQTHQFSDYANAQRLFLRRKNAVKIKPQAPVRRFGQLLPAKCAGACD